MRSRTSDIRIPRPDALPLSNRDSMVSEVHYEVLMTGIKLKVFGSFGNPTVIFYIN